MSSRQTDDLAVTTKKKKNDRHQFSNIRHIHSLCSRCQFRSIVVTVTNPNANSTKFSRCSTNNNRGLGTMEYSVQRTSSVRAVLANRGDLLLCFSVQRTKIAGYYNDLNPTGRLAHKGMISEFDSVGGGDVGRGGDIHRMARNYFIY